MNIFKIGAVIFLSFGFIFLIASLLLIGNTLNIVWRGELVEGIITDYMYMDNSYYPIVRIPSKSNLTFTSETGSDKKNYSLGETIEVYYIEEKTEKSKIKNFMNIWFMPSIFSICTLTALGFGYATWYNTFRYENKRIRLTETGERLKAEVTKIEHKTKYVDHSHVVPYIVRAKPKDENLDITFRSQYLSHEPDLKPGDEVEVLINKRNIKDYYLIV